MTSREPIHFEIVASSIAGLEADQDKAIALAKSADRPVEVHQKLWAPANSPCLCGASGLKWKNCCKDEAVTFVTFYPPGFQRERPRFSRAAGLFMMSMLAGYASPVLGSPRRLDDVQTHNLIPDARRPQAGERNGR